VIKAYRVSATPNRPARSWKSCQGAAPRRNWRVTIVFFWPLADGRQAITQVTQADVRKCLFLWTAGDLSRSATWGDGSRNVMFLVAVVATLVCALAPLSGLGLAIDPSGRG
jgi:hypothetical protein